MNFIRKMRKLQHNAKALSPVVASIILIAVTVAVSIAVAAWMGGMSSGFMQTEQLAVGTPTFQPTASPATITIVVKNTGTSAVTVSSMTVNNAGAAFNTTSTPATIAANGQATFVITTDSSTPIVVGNNYQIKVVTSKSNTFSNGAVAT